MLLPIKQSFEIPHKKNDFTITVEAEGINKKTDKKERVSVSDANGVTYYVDSRAGYWTKSNQRFPILL